MFCFPHARFSRLLPEAPFQLHGAQHEEIAALSPPARPAPQPLLLLPRRRKCRERQRTRPDGRVQARLTSRPPTVPWTQHSRVRNWGELAPPRSWSCVSWASHWLLLTSSPAPSWRGSEGTTGPPYRGLAPSKVELVTSARPTNKSSRTSFFRNTGRRVRKKAAAVRGGLGRPLNVRVPRPPPSFLWFPPCRCTR